ncbi:MAG TPA: RodZ domain-containing protein [Acidimicrobiales bacterium]|nr:RodZ domain-containing protein [Acidimicrobiales bacterium]
MLVALIAVVVVVVGAVVAKLTWRPSNDEVHSVNDYHSALGTIGDLARRNPPPVTGRTDRPKDRSSPLDRGPHQEGSPHQERRPLHARSETPLVFDDDRLASPTPSASTGDDAPIFRSDRARRQALSSMNHRPRRWVLAMAVVAVLLVFGGLAYVGSHRNNNHPTKKSTSPPTHASAAVNTTPSQPRTTTSQPRPTTATTRPKPKPKRSTPTTAPPQIAALTSTATSATYPAPGTSYQVTVKAPTQPCWIQVTSAATGATLWAGTIQTGDSQIIQASGTTMLDVGALGSVVTLNGIPVVFPTPLNVPFEATFTPGASASTTPTTAPTASTTTTS